MRYLNGWHPFESIRFDLVKITMWRCLILHIWEQQKQLLRNQRVIQILQAILVDYDIHLILVYYSIFCLLIL